MADLKSAWAIGLDYGCEGKTSPLTLCETEEEAKAICKAMSSANGTGTYCVEVPFFPGSRGPHD